MDVFEMSFSKVFPLLVAKAQRKGRTADEVYAVTRWLTGYSKEDLTENNYRCLGIAGRLLDHVCDDMAARGIDTLYLLTDHTGFYERYGWHFHCMAQGDGEDRPSRMYIHRSDRP